VKAHLEDCASCRNSFSDLGTIHSTCFPQAGHFEVEREANEEVRLRNSILRAATREGARFSDQVKPQTQHENRQGRIVGSFRVIRGWGIAASVFVICGCVVLGLALRQSQRAHIPMGGSFPRITSPGRRRIRQFGSHGGTPCVPKHVNPAPRRPWTRETGRSVE